MEVVLFDIERKVINLKVLKCLNGGLLNFSNGLSKVLFKFCK